MVQMDFSVSDTGLLGKRKSEFSGVKPKNNSNQKVILGLTPFSVYMPVTLTENL